MDVGSKTDWIGDWGGAKKESTKAKIPIHLGIFTHKLKNKENCNLSTREYQNSTFGNPRKNLVKLELKKTVQASGNSYIALLRNSSNH